MKTKRILSALLAAAMLISSMAAVTITASAATEKKTMNFGCGVISTRNNIYYGNQKKFRVLSLDGNVTSGDTVSFSDGTNSVAAENALFVIAENGYGETAYNTNGKDWASSEARAWCGNEFFSAAGISDQEKAAILKTTKTDAQYITNEVTYYERQMDDKAFCLSIKEAEKYFGTNNDRILGSKWWLRSDAIALSRLIAVVNEDGSIWPVNGEYNFLPLRPAFNLNKSSVLFTSAINFNGAIGNYEGGDWNLTLKDSSREFEIVGARKNENILTVKYANAKTTADNENEKISYIVTDVDQNEIKYYASQPSETANGNIEIILPQNMAENDRVFLFNEQDNGEKRTNYASALQEVYELRPSMDVLAYNKETKSFNKIPYYYEDCVMLKSNTKTWEGGKTYFADGNITINDGVTVSGNVTIILKDGCKLNVNGGINAKGRSITIYGQAEGTGTLTANGDNKATGGIAVGTLNVHGGVVNANGGALYPGIGDGDKTGGSTVNVYGGVINATGTSAAGIGGGTWFTGVSEIDGGSGGTVNVYGGVVNATAIGSGAGIGGGVGGIGGTVRIYGGTVNANGGTDSASIGGGGGKKNHGTLVISENMTITDNGTKKTITASEVPECASVSITDPDYDPELEKPVYRKYENGAFVTETCEEVPYYTSNPWRGTSWKNKWYAAEGKATLDSVTVCGDVNLILKDGCDLTVTNEITVEEGGSLKVYAQSEGENKGKLTSSGIVGEGNLIIHGGDITLADGAGISVGNAVIYGGDITSTGGSNAAGIGGDVEIYGGNVTATGGSNAAGIGGNAVICGGDVIATGGSYASGIGGGNRAGGGNITISGGNVNAIGGNSGAGIGGGFTGIGGNITISGGNIEARGGSYASGIGGGEGAGGGNITISGGTVNATGGAGSGSISGGTGIGVGNNGYGGNITISGGDVTATALGYFVSGIGGEKIRVDGGTVTAIGGKSDCGIDGELITDCQIKVKAAEEDEFISLPSGKSISEYSYVFVNGNADKVSLAFEDGTFTATKNGENANSGILAVALYSDDDMNGLLGVKAFKKAKEQTGIGNFAKDGYLKAYWWESFETMMPVSKTANWQKWSSETSLPVKSGGYTLENDVTLSDAWSVPPGVEIKLDLNGHTIRRELEEAAAGGCVISTGGNLTLYDGSESKEGTVTGGNNSGNGGGIYVAGGKLTLRDITISGNYANGGGGLYITENAAVETENCHIDENTAAGAAGIYNKGILNVNGGTLSENRATNNSGGFYTDKGAASFTDCEIKGNRSDNYGGAFFIDYTSSVSLKGCTVSGNSAANGGGAFEMERDGSALTLENSTVTGNSVDNIVSDIRKGGGIHFYKGSVTFKGVVTVKGNTCAESDNNFCMRGNPATFDASEMSGDSELYINNSVMDYISGITENNSGALYFEQTKPDKWTSNTSLPTASGDYQLQSDVTLSDAWNIPAGTYMTLDLNGHTIERDLWYDESDGSVIITSGKLTLLDSSGNKTSLITGGNSSTKGGGIFVNKGSVVLRDITISDNYAKNGGGLFINEHATVEMENCYIDGNYATAAAGIYNNGTLAVSGSSLSQNRASNNAGGFYTSSGEASFTDCEIKGNRSDAYGGAFFIDYTSSVSLKGCTVSQNSAANGGGAFEMERDGSKLTIEDSSVTRNSIDNIVGGISKGGGIHFYKGSVTLKGLITIKSNTCDEDANNICIRNTWVTFDATEMSANSEVRVNSAVRDVIEVTPENESALVDE